jgi:hypothetical protein
LPRWPPPLEIKIAARPALSRFPIAALDRENDLPPIAQRRQDDEPQVTPPALVYTPSDLTSARRFDLFTA